MKYPSLTVLTAVLVLMLIPKPTDNWSFLGGYIAGIATILFMGAMWSSDRGN